MAKDLQKRWVLRRDSKTENEVFPCLIGVLWKQEVKTEFPPLQAGVVFSIVPSCISATVELRQVIYKSEVTQIMAFHQYFSRSKATSFIEDSDCTFSRVAQLF